MESGVSFSLDINYFSASFSQPVPKDKLPKRGI